MSIVAIMTLQCAVIYASRFDHGLVSFLFTHIWFPYGAVISRGTSCCGVPYCLFLCSLVWFSLFYGFIHLSTSGFLICQIAASILQRIHSVGLVIASRSRVHQKSSPNKNEHLRTKMETNERSVLHSSLCSALLRISCKIFFFCFKNVNILCSYRIMRSRMVAAYPQSVSSDYIFRFRKHNAEI